MPRPAPDNDFGVTVIASYDGLIDSKTLDQQFADAGIKTESHELTQIVGMGGNARLVFYTSPKSGRPVTVLAVPHRPDIDQFAEDYYYFEGMGRYDALAEDPDARWAELYDRCVALSDIA